MRTIYGDREDLVQLLVHCHQGPRTASLPLGGVLEIDGADLHFAVGVAPRTEPPQLILTSVRRDGLVVRPQGLSATLTRKDFASVMMFAIGALPSPSVGNFDFVDGELRVTFAGALPRPRALA